MIGAYHQGLQLDVARPLPERAHNDRSVLLPSLSTCHIGLLPGLNSKRSSGHVFRRTRPAEGLPPRHSPRLPCEAQSPVWVHQEKTQLTQ